MGKIFPEEKFYQKNVTIVSETQWKNAIFFLFILLIFEKEKKRQSERICSDAKVSREVMSM